MDGAGRTAVAGLQEAAGLLGAARRVVVFSGAGISTDSKIIVWTLDNPSHSRRSMDPCADAAPI
jgi:hypothetical protein